jgi:ligand-binding sensor domain-containing protein
MVKTKIEIEEMLKRADRLNRLDSYVAELINTNPTETVTSQIFDVQGVLSSSYIRVLDRGVVYNTASGQVAPIPSNNTTCVYKDVTRNILYVGTATAGVWEFNLTTKVGKVYNTAGGATSGQQIQSNVIRSISKDETMNMLYVGTDAGIWYLSGAGAGGRITTLTAFIGQALPSNSLRSIMAFHSGGNSNLYVGTDSGVWTYNGTTDVGKVFNTVGGAGAGSQLPNNAVSSIDYDSTNGILYAGTAAGIWQYTVGTDTGKVYNFAGGAGVGQQLNSNTVLCVHKDSINNILYAGTDSGMWQYTVGTDAGKRYNTFTGAGSGLQLPNDYVTSVFKDTSRNIVYASTFDVVAMIPVSGVWVYNIASDTGGVFTTGTNVNGSSLPSNRTNFVVSDITRNVIYVATIGGVWQYAYLANVNYNGTQTRTVTYQQFTTDILNEPIMIDHIRLMCSDSTQLTKPIKLYYYTPTGKVESKYYSTLNNRMATDGDNTIIDINLPKPIVFGSENYFALDILPSTTVFFSIFYRQINKWELLNNIIGFRDNQFDSENSKTL